MKEIPQLNRKRNTWKIASVNQADMFQCVFLSSWTKKKLVKLCKIYV